MFPRSAPHRRQQPRQWEPVPRETPGSKGRGLAQHRTAAHLRVTKPGKAVFLFYFVFAARQLQSYHQESRAVTLQDTAPTPSPGRRGSLETRSSQGRCAGPVSGSGLGKRGRGLGLHTQRAGAVSTALVPPAGPLRPGCSAAQQVHTEQGPRRRRKPSRKTARPGEGLNAPSNLQEPRPPRTRANC